MKNLFKRTYIRHDGNFTVASNQKRVFITPRELEFELSGDPTVRQATGVLGVFKTLDEVDTSYQGRESFWHYLYNADDKVCIVAGEAEFVELLVQYWKSIFQDIGLLACYQLYLLLMSNENLLALYQKTSIDVDYNAKAVTVDALGVAAFEAVFQRVEPSEFLGKLVAMDLPIEYLLLDYFGADSQVLRAKQSVGAATFYKVKSIVAENVVSQLADAKKDYLLNTHQFYRLAPDQPEALVTDPLQYIQTDPQLSWVLDPHFTGDNATQVIWQYGLPLLREFFATYQKLFDFQYEEAFALDYLIADDIAGLLEYDAQDQKGNFFGDERFVFKINGLLVSYTYQLHRLGRKDFLQQYRLRTTG